MKITAKNTDLLAAIEPCAKVAKGPTLLMQCVRFKSEDGAELAFKGFAGRATDDDLRQIPFSVILEIVAEVHRFESLSRKTAGE